MLRKLANAAPSLGGGHSARSGSHLSVIGPDVRIVGDIITQGEMQIDGQVEGDITCQTLVVGEGARITGEVSADSVRVHGLRERDVQEGMDPDEAMMALMRFIGSRPLVGYYLEFDVGLIDRAIFPLLGVGLPQRRIEVSSMFYDWQRRKLPPYQEPAQIDLRFATMMRELDLPMESAHDALSDAVMAALAFIKLRHLLGG